MPTGSFITALAVAWCMVSLALAAQEQDDLERGDAGAEAGLLELVEGLDAGQRLALSHQRPLLVVFGAQWCVWCRKMEQELESDEAAAIRRRWVIAKVDVDVESAVAHQLGVESLPAMRIIDTEGKPIASHTGFLTSARLATWLDEHSDDADPVLSKTLHASGVPSAGEIAELVALLQRRGASVRESAGRRLRDHRSVTAAAVVGALREGGLSSQLMALDILEDWDAPVSDIDPWNPESLADDALQPLLQWLRDLPASDPADDAASPAETG